MFHITQIVHIFECRSEAFANYFHKRMHIGHGHDEDEHEEEEETEEGVIEPEYGVDANDVGDGHEEKDEEEEEGSAVHRLLHQHHPGPVPKNRLD